MLLKTIQAQSAYVSFTFVIDERDAAAKYFCYYFHFYLSRHFGGRGIEVNA